MRRFPLLWVLELSVCVRVRVRERERESTNKLKKSGSRFLICLVGCWVGLRLHWALFLRETGL